jgi:tetratricopeptide (TPR) repeat protein
MARGAAQAQRKRRDQPQPKRKRSAPTYEQAMFFPRLRRQAKWVFVFLALVFGIGFVAFGVGSGSTGIGDILRGNFFGGGSNSTDSRIKEDQKKIARNAKNINTYLDLATLYQQKQDTSRAIATLERAARVEPRNLDVLNRLAGVYRGRAEQARTDAVNAQSSLASSNIAPPGLNPNTTIGQAFTADPLSESLKTRASNTYSTMVRAYSSAEGAYKRVARAARGTSQEANAQLQLGSVAELAGDVTTAVQAYTRFLRLAPDSTNAALVQQSIARLGGSLPKSGR